MLVISGIVALIATSVAHAQIRGRVLDPSSAPLAGALVELWSTTTRLAGQLTDERGGFEFAGDESKLAVLLVVRRNGSEPARLLLPQAGAITVTLVPFAEQLAAATAIAVPLCQQNREDPQARALWNALRRRYRPFTPDLGYWSPVRSISARVSERQLGFVDTTQAVDGWLVAGGRYFEEQSRRVETRGYAVRYDGLLNQRFDQWEYPRLDSFFAGHFLDSLFGRLHRLRTEAGPPLALVFCPRSTNQSWIEGRIELDADSAVARVSWTFHTRESREYAGGQVLFTRPSTSTATPVLFPLVGMFWRKVIADYYQEWTQYLDWHSCTDHPDAIYCR